MDIQIEKTPLGYKIMYSKPVKFMGKKLTHLVLECTDGIWSGKYIRITPTGRKTVGVPNMVNPKFAKDAGESVLRLAKGK